MSRHSQAGFSMTNHSRLSSTARLGACLIAALFAVLVGVTGEAHALTQSADPVSMPAAVSVPAARAAKNVAVIRMDTGDEPITWVTAYSVKRRIKLAEAAGASAMVIEINTPGGELGAMLDIADAIKSSSIQNSVAWVNLRAFSAGAIIALACREIVVADACTFGDAAPIAVDPLRGIATLGPTERAKLLAPLLTEVVDSARRSGYDEKLVQGFVTLGVELWLVENTASGERLSIDRKEYELLFGTPPAAGSPRITSVPESVLNAPVASPQSTPIDSVLPKAKKRVRPLATPSKATPTTQPAPVTPTFGNDPDAKLQPASPAMGNDLINQVSDSLSMPTTRRTLTAADAGQWKVVEYIADGNSIFTMKAGEMLRYGLATQRVNSDNDLKAYFGATTLTRLEPAWSEGLVAFLSSFWVKGILVVIFLVTFFIEMTHPGAVVPGVIAAVALGLLFGPAALIGLASWWAIAALAFGIAMLALELFILPGFGIFGVVGLISLFAGLLGSFVPAGEGLFPSSPGGNSSLVYGMTTLTISTVVAMIFIYFIAKHFGSLPLLGRLVLTGQSGDAVDEGETGAILATSATATADLSAAPALRSGDTGIAVTTLRPSGRMQVGDYLYDVVADTGIIDAGRRVRVISASNFRIVVEAID